MSVYSNKEKLILLRNKRIRITQEVYDILRYEKGKQKISMAKMVCNAIIEKYG